jgi:ribosomal protein S11
LAKRREERKDDSLPRNLPIIILIKNIYEEKTDDFAAEDCSKVALEAGLKKVKVYVKGPGNGRESAIRSIHNSGVEVTEIIDVTPMPHNGCRPPKRRRV